MRSVIPTGRALARARTSAPGTDPLSALLAFFGIDPAAWNPVKPGKRNGSGRACRPHGYADALYRRDNRSRERRPAMSPARVKAWRKARAEKV